MERQPLRRMVKRRNSHCPLHRTVLARVAMGGTALSLLLLGCQDADCTSELNISLAPRDTTIAVGASFTARLAMTTCGGRRPVASQIALKSRDTAIAVSSPNGVITGRAPGETLIDVGDGNLEEGKVGFIHVVVLARP